MQMELQPLVDLSTITTDVYAYHGINQLLLKV